MKTRTVDNTHVPVCGMQVSREERHLGNRLRIFALISTLLCFATGTQAAIRKGAVQPPSLVAYTQLALDFEPNRGQAEGPVSFLSHGFDRNVLLTPNEAILKWHSQDTNLDSGVAFRFIGANPSAQSIGMEEMPSHSNYLIGSDPNAWRTAIPNYAKVKFESVYPGVDLVYYGNQGLLEYNLLLAPGADAGRIRLEVQGARKLWLDAAGDLVVETSAGPLRQHRPVVFQDWAGHRHIVEAHYRLRGKREVVFSLGKYDKTQPLVIDPTISYSTNAIGGSHVAVDVLGNAYVVGSTSFTDVPVTPGALQGPCKAVVIQQRHCTNVFIAKLNATGTALVYATFLGGSADDEGDSIAVDATGNVFVSGHTFSLDFPVTPDALQTPGGRGFVAKLNATGTGLIFSATVKTATVMTIDAEGNVYLAGDGYLAKLNSAGTALVYSRAAGEWVGGIAVDRDQNVYVAGSSPTAYTGVPSTPGAYNDGGHMFITKISADGMQIVFSAAIGGAIYPIVVAGFTLDEIQGIDGISVDAAGNSYVTGYTIMSGCGDNVDFPVTPGAVQAPLPRCPQVEVGRTYTWTYSAFIAKLNSTGTALIYSSVPGGGVGTGVSVDDRGIAWITGYTYYPNFPTTPDAAEPAFDGGVCPAPARCLAGFMAALSPDGTALLYSTYLNTSEPESVAVNPGGEVVLTGRAGKDFPVTPGALRPSPGYSTARFVAKINIASAGLSMNSAEYCIGDTWNLTASTTSPDAAIRLIGSSDNQFWEMANWSRTDASGNVRVDGTFQEGSDGSHELRVNVDGKLSNTVSFQVSPCKR